MAMYVSYLDAENRSPCHDHVFVVRLDVGKLIRVCCCVPLASLSASHGWQAAEGVLLGYSSVCNIWGLPVHHTTPGPK